MKVVFSGGGQGEIAGAIMQAMSDHPSKFLLIDVARDLMSQAPIDEAPDVEICTTGRMRIRASETVGLNEVHSSLESNYVLPRCFTERIIATFRRDGQPGLIIHLGSNAPWYGNVGAEEYAAGKTALRKYLELRAKSAKAYGIRISLLGFAGVGTENFWRKATEGAPPELSAPIVAGTRTPLTAAEVAQAVLATVLLPANVCIRDALITSVDYQ